MLHIILTILEIIGILILVILALLLVIIGVVLFVPIRYRVNGKKDAESLYIKAEVYWLLHLFRLKAVYPEPGQVIAKILWFTVYDSKKEDNADFLCCTCCANNFYAFDRKCKPMVMASLYVDSFFQHDTIHLWML